MAKKIKPTKLTSEELQSLRTSLQEINQGKISLADLEIQKSEAILLLKGLKDKFSEVENSITKKYGEDITLNIETGEIKPKENG